MIGDNFVWKTTNCGNNWGSGGEIPGNPQLHTIYFSSPDSGFVAGEDGDVFYTTDGGDDWDYDTAASNITTKTIRDFSVLDTNIGVVVGDNGLLVYVSTDSINSGIGNDNVGSAMSFLLSQNYPNPFNPNTNISFKIPVKSFVKLAVYDINGRKISTLVNEIKVRGNMLLALGRITSQAECIFIRLWLRELIHPTSSPRQRKCCLSNEFSSPPCSVGVLSLTGSRLVMGRFTLGGF